MLAPSLPAGLLQAACACQIAGTPSSSRSRTRCCCPPTPRAPTTPRTRRRTCASRRRSRSPRSRRARLARRLAPPRLRADQRRARGCPRCRRSRRCALAAAGARRPRPRRRRPRRPPAPASRCIRRSTGARGRGSLSPSASTSPTLRSARWRCSRLRRSCCARACRRRTRWARSSASPSWRACSAASPSSTGSAGGHCCSPARRRRRCAARRRRRLRSASPALVAWPLVDSFFCWNFSWSGLMWTVSAELLPDEIRAPGMGLAVVLFWLLSFALAQGLDPLLNALTPQGLFSALTPRAARSSSASLSPASPRRRASCRCRSARSNPSTSLD